MKSELKKELRSHCEELNYHFMSDKGSEVIKSVLNSKGFDDEQIEKAKTKALKYTEKETYQAMEALVHNLNSMHSRAGAQVPFTSVNFGTDTSEEGRMVSRNLLLSTESGLGAGETAIFPISIFKVKEGVNYNPEDPNYDLFKLSIRVSAKRLFPTYEFLDAPYNLQYYKKGDFRTELATMGCVDGIEMITYKIKDNLYVENFERAWSRISSMFEVKESGVSKYCDVSGVSIYDTTSKRFVKCKKFICNPDKGDWYRITCTGGRTLLATADHPLHTERNGRTYIKDLCISDKIEVTNTAYSEGHEKHDVNDAWVLGLTLCDGKYEGGLLLSLGMDEDDIIQKYQEIMLNQGFNTEVIERHRKEKGDYKDIVIRGSQKDYCDALYNMFNAYPKRNRIIPSEVFTWDENARKAFLCGMIDIMRQRGCVCAVKMDLMFAR